ncbi:MAG: exodeoxyribonuclease III [Propionibacteriaceae bacterium]|nr:exodeoxyribonuclease III [Propionibacteriaceae bacterium]
MRIASYNVNGIRAAQRRGFEGWLERRRPDVVALQEMRCPADLVPEGVFGDLHLAYHPGNRPGRNGVAIASTVAPTAVRQGFGSRVFDAEGRYLEVDLDLPGRPPLTIGSLYLTKGSPKVGPDADLARYRRKMRFMASFRAYLVAARRRARREGREFLVMGDFNVAHERADLKNWRGAGQKEGFLPEEREWFGSLLSERTLVDVVRRLHPDAEGPYSWWSWMPGAFDRDSGWRIDYHLATPGLAGTAVAGGTDREASAAGRVSDHAPVVVDYDC